MLIALRSKEVDLKLISTCFGNCDTESSLKNTLSMFNVLQLEQQFRQANGNHEKLVYSKPTVAVGMATALDGSQMDATDFHGSDGLGDVHLKAPHFTAPQDWIDLFTTSTEIPKDLPFVPSRVPAYEEILRVLREEEPNTVVIVAIGPLMNLAKAAELDPTTFSRVKHVVSMGGTLSEPGNVTPYAEFNVFSDALAAAKVYELTSTQVSTQKQLQFTLFPLDITGKHLLLESDYKAVLETASSGSPLIEWAHVWINTTFNTMKTIYGYDLMTEAQKQLAGPVGFEMHDPLALWYGLTSTHEGWVIDQDLDIRVECIGEFTKGMTVKDTRQKPKRDEPVKNDHGTWLSTNFGNRVNVAVQSPYGNGPSFGKVVLEVLFA